MRRDIKRMTGAYCAKAGTSRLRAQRAASGRSTASGSRSITLSSTRVDQPEPGADDPYADVIGDTDNVLDAAPAVALREGGRIPDTCHDLVESLLRHVTLHTYLVTRDLPPLEGQEGQARSARRGSPNTVGVI
jgi:hypothetical protein